MAFLPSYFYKGLGKCLTCQQKIPNADKECYYCGEPSPTDWGRYQFSSLRGTVCAIGGILMVGIVAMGIIATLFF